MCIFVLSTVAGWSNHLASFSYARLILRNLTDRLSGSSRDKQQGVSNLHSNQHFGPSKFGIGRALCFAVCPSIENCNLHILGQWCSPIYN